MKIIHISDLHIGKRVNHLSMMEDQKHILAEIVDIVRAEKPDAVLIAGDVYDRPIPSEEAVALYDDFSYALSQTGTHTMVIYGNHDSAERVACNSRQLRGANLFVSPVFENAKEAVRVTLTDEYGDVDFHLIPFVRPHEVRSVYPDAVIENPADAIREVIAHLDIDPSHRNVALAHLFLQNAALSGDSETAFVGGEEAVPSDLFSVFDYTALGHLHGPQKVGVENVRYSGSPIKYSFSEIRQKKSVTVVELKEKGDINIRFVPLVPLRDMGELRGTFEEVTRCGAEPDLYYRVILTDEQEIPDAADRLREFYPNMMLMSYDNSTTRAEAADLDGTELDKQDMMDVFAELFQKFNGRDMSEAQTNIIKHLIEEIEGGKV